MPFDAEGYRKAARAQGIPDSEIEKDIAEEMGMNNKPADFAFPEKGDAQAKGADTWMAPAAVGGALGAGAAIAPGIYKSLKDKFSSSTAPTRIEPVMLPETIDQPKILTASEQRQQMVSNREQPKSNPLNSYTEQKYGVPLATLEQKTGGPLKSIADIDLVGSTLQKGGNVSVNTPGAFTPASAYTPTTTPTPAPALAPIAPTPSVQEGVATGNAAKSVQAVVAQELDKATGVAPTIATFNRDANGNIEYPKGMSKAAKQGAEAFAQQYPDHAKALATEGRFGILGAGSGDNNLFNSYGSDMMKRIRDEVNQGQMVGPYANYETKINPAIKGISPETAIGKDLAQLREAQIGGNYGTLGTPATIGGKKGGLITGPNTVPKAIKAGGPAMLLMAMADAAKAAQQGKYGEAAVRGADIATDYIPGIAQLKQGLSPTSVGVSTLSPEQVQQRENFYKLGSPYAQTEEAKKARLREKAGAGRGIAPPSAYMR